MTTRAQIATRTAWLGKEFGESFARRIFGDEVVDALPRSARGKNVGKFKAEIEWQKVERGGWVRHEMADAGKAGHVENRVGKVIFARLVARDFHSGRVTEIYAEKEDA